MVVDIQGSSPRYNRCNRLGLASVIPISKFGPGIAVPVLHLTDEFAGGGDLLNDRRGKNDKSPRADNSTRGLIASQAIRTAGR